MTDFDIQEAKGVIAAIIKENGTTKVIQTPGDVDIDYDGAGNTAIVSLAFLECATSYGQDTSKTINKTDIVGSQNQKISDGSIEDTLTYDAQVLNPVALGDDTIEETTEAIFHGLDSTANPQYLMTSHGLRAAIRSSNTYTIRLFMGCDLDANGDADVTTAKDIVDLERVHLASVSGSVPAGGEVTVSVSFDAETVTFPTAWNALPN